MNRANHKGIKIWSDILKFREIVLDLGIDGMISKRFLN